MRTRTSTGFPHWGKRSRESGQVRILEVPLAEIRPAPENDRLYRPADLEDPAILALAESIRELGVMEPLVVTADGYIVSGHRRYAAAQLAGLDAVPCRVEPIRRQDDPDGFLVRLREFNRQREKTRAEKLREEVVTADPEDAYQSLIEHRRRQSAVNGTARIVAVGRKHRAEISQNKRPMLRAAQEAIQSWSEFWPLSVRQVFYILLRNPPLRHAKKPDSVFRNDRASYRDLSDLLVRARLFGEVPMGAIDDETRPVSVWQCFGEVGAFMHAELGRFLKGYWRDLLQSQPNHMEIVAEKLTVHGVARPVAMEYCIPLTIGRGYCGLVPRAGLVERFEKSGKEKLVLILVSDFDPDGEEIAASFVRSLRDDFGVEESRVHAVKAALTAEQVERFELPRNMDAKKGSANYKKFVARYGRKAFELEALSPPQLQASLRETIDRVIDVDAFNAELVSERADAVFLQGVRDTVHEVLSGLEL